MQEVLYINVDDEITSILDKIRQQRAREIFLVVPQGATFLNSVLNLKILKREVEKLGKSLVVVTPNDQKAKTIVERAGLKTEDYQRLHYGHETDGSLGDEQYYQQEVREASEKAVQEVGRENLSVGSKTFYSQAGASSQPPASFNNPPTSSSSSTSSFNQTPSSPSEATINDKEYNYFHQKTSSSRKKHRKKKSKKGKIFFWLLALVLLFSLGGGGYYLANYPKLLVKIEPRSQSVREEVKVLVDSQAEKVDPDQKVIPGEYLEMTVSKKKEFKTTGQKVLDKNGAKARGVVIIRNYYSDKPQPLVKTTRVLSQSGKLFRLTKSVIVPGKKGEEPGEIAVPVEADKPGQEYNIGPETFTIEGFKGGPKYEKFKVEAKGPMTGGVTSSEHKVVAAVSKSDLDKARKITLEELDKELKEEIQKRIGSDKAFLESAVEKEVVASESSHLQDSITDSFTYTVTYKLKLITFFRRDLEKLAKYLVEKKLGPLFAVDEQSIKFQLKRGIADFNKKTMTAYADLQARGWFKINEEELKNKLINKNLSELKAVLGEKNGIKKASINLAPSWVSHSPKQPEKIQLEVIRK